MSDTFTGKDLEDELVLYANAPSVCGQKLSWHGRVYFPIAVLW